MSDAPTTTVITTTPAADEGTDAAEVAEAVGEAVADAIEPLAEAVTDAVEALGDAVEALAENDDDGGEDEWRTAHEAHEGRLAECERLQAEVATRLQVVEDLLAEPQEPSQPAQEVLPSPDLTPEQEAALEEADEMNSQPGFIKALARFI